MEVLQDIESLAYYPCADPSHESEPLNLVCGELHCRERGLLCIHCESDCHQGHKVLHLRDYLKKLYLSCRLDFDSESFLAQVKGMEADRDIALERLEQLRCRVEDMLCEAKAQILRLYQGLSSEVTRIYEINSNLQVTIRSFTRRVREQSNGAQPSSQSRRLQDYIKQVLRHAIIVESCGIVKSQQEEIEDVTRYKVVNMGNQIKSIAQQFKDKLHKVCALGDAITAKFITEYQIPISECLKSPIVSLTEAKTSSFRWSPTLKSSEARISGNRIERISTNTTQRFCLMSNLLTPGQSPHSGEGIRRAVWMFRIKKLVNWIGVGIASEKTIVLREYRFSFEPEGHGGYMVGNNGTQWAHTPSPENKIFSADSFTTNDFVVVQFWGAPEWRLDFYILKPQELAKKVQSKYQVPKSNPSIEILSSYLSASVANKASGPLCLDVSSLSPFCCLKVKKGQDYYPCVILSSTGDCVEIVN